MRTGISPFFWGGGGEWENGIYCTGKGMNNFENGSVISLFRGLWLHYFTNFCTNKPFFGSGEIQLYISNISSNAWMKFCQFPCAIVFLSVKWHAHLTKIKMAYDLENVSCILHNYGHRNVLRFSNQCGNPHRKLQTIIFNWFWLHRDNYCWRGSEVEWRYVRGSDEDGER